ncbi:MAG: hypothetical protein KIT83_18155 [Bryobacterales bacterium]|nr:hypothetical protein [Bryobacterales bacterium]
MNPAVHLCVVLLLVALPAVAQRGVQLPVELERTAALRSETIEINGLSRESQYSLLVSADSLAGLQDDARVAVQLVQGAVILAAKTLHTGDADFYTQFRVPSAGAAQLVIANHGAQGNYTLQVNRWPLSNLVRRGPNARWQDAMDIPLGGTVFASGDDTPYIPLPWAARAAVAEDPAHTHWYRFQFSGPPRLVFFQVDLMERDNIPVNIGVYREQAGKLEEFFEGEDPVTLPHEVQALPGNKFTPRLLEEPGAYYVAVRAAHPEYKLRTRVYNQPPYKDPKEAVRTALDYILGSGDSWHANTPRRGGTLSRVDAVHQETSLCVACHVTHFSQRAQLYATRQGYPVVQRQQLQFMTERFYQNPRPLYGFEEEGAVWSRMISAAANVLGRMAHLLDLFEQQVSGERRGWFHDGVNEYLRLYYDGRDKLPGDETNGNTPLVSAQEVAWYAWASNKDGRLPELVAKGEVKNLIDLCYQTLALAEMDPEHYRDKIAANAKRILSLQREDGQWAAPFKQGEPTVEFQTGHALWALHAAGIPAEHPQVAKSLAYLLSRQQRWGGWLDPLQSYENFRTPFRETQMAVLALSAYYPNGPRARGWDATPPERLATNPTTLLRQLDEVWSEGSPALLQDIHEAAESNDALIRQAAIEALGRLAIAPRPEALGDPSKLVQRTAAWATRQALTRNGAAPRAALQASLASSDDRIRWGAVRAFHTHLKVLAEEQLFADALLARMEDPVPSIRMEAAKALWQLWFWNASDAVRSPIEDAFLARLGKETHPWVQQNLRHGIYNLADENIRYLYNNWVPGLARQEDRDRVIRGRLRVEARLAAKFAQTLESGSSNARKELLRALTEYPLRRADIYDLQADLAHPAPPVYNRIGNDVEQITFFGPSAERFAQALSPLLDETDPEMRRLAGNAVLLVRETRFGDVNRLAGATGQHVQFVTAKVQQMPEAVEVARALKPPPVTRASATPGTASAPKRRLDETFFRGYVQPILEKRGKDGYACVHCHASHAIFNATWGTVMRVVDTDTPQNSLILLKPTSTAESEGVAGAGTVAHGGGIRFAKDSPEYVTILEWIKGAVE